VTETNENGTLVHGAQAFAYYLGYRYHKRREENRKNKILKWVSAVLCVAHVVGAVDHIVGDR
jgi:hypothetical protein